MAQSVTHILVPIILVALFRDFFVKNKKRFPLHYVLIAGLGGILPDIDLLAYWVFSFLGWQTEMLHRTLTHSIFFPILFLVLALILSHDKIPALGKHKLKIRTICLMISFGSAVHIILDLLLQGYVYVLYPLSQIQYGVNLTSLLPQSVRGMALPTLDGILLIVWLVYLEWKHKISDFI